MEPINSLCDDEELKSIRTSFQAVFDRLFCTTQDVQNDPIVRIVREPDIPHLKNLSVPGSPHNVDDVIEDAFTISDYRLRMNHPRFFGFVPGPVSPLSYIGDCLSSAFNSFAGSKLQGSGVAVVERTLLQWLASRIGLPESAGGVFVSGGSMANMTAMVLARDCILPSGQESLGVAYVSDQTHHSVMKALRIIGVKSDRIRVIPSDNTFRMLVPELEEAINKDIINGLLPFVIVGTSGTTNTGSIDPLAALAKVRDERGMWLHIDGAYGATACLSATRSSEVSGLGLSDSVSWDAHKWLFQTYSCSMLIVRSKLNLAKVFSNDGDYLRDALEDEEIPNFWNFGIELTRPSRVMKLWFTLRVLGVDRLGHMIDHGFVLAETAAEEIIKLPNWELTSAASMAIVTFRYAPPGKTEEHLNSLNTVISRTVAERDIAGILTTRLRGMVVLRICSINPLLSSEGMRTIIQQVNDVAKSVNGELET